MSGGVDVKPVVSRRDLRAFIRLPVDVYRDNPHWVRPLDSVVRHTLDFRRSPFWQHAEGALFIAWRDGVPVGRISAHIDRHHLERWNDATGFFGFFECIDDIAVAAALFESARAWQRSHGMRQLRGPFNPSVNQECGFLAQGFDRPPVVGMTYTPPYYCALAAACGFSVVQNLWAYEKTKENPSPPLLYAVADRLRRNPHITIRPFDRRHADRETGIICDLFNECWYDNWGFSAMSYEDMREHIRAGLPFLDISVALFACHDGEPVGFSLVLPDLNEIVKHLNGRLGPINMLRALFLKRRVKGCRNVIVGLKRDHRFRGIPALLYVESEPFLRSRYERIEFSWVLDENTAVHALTELIGTTRYKQYCIMEQAI